MLWILLRKPIWESDRGLKFAVYWEEAAIFFSHLNFVAETSPSEIWLLPRHRPTNFKNELHEFIKRENILSPQKLESIKQTRTNKTLPVHLHINKKTTSFRKKSMHSATSVCYRPNCAAVWEHAVPSWERSWSPDTTWAGAAERCSWECGKAPEHLRQRAKKKFSKLQCKIYHQCRMGKREKKKKCTIVNWTYFTPFLCVFRQTNVDCIVSLVIKFQSVKHVLHLHSSVWAEHVERISRLVCHRWVRLKEEKKKDVSIHPCRRFRSDRGKSPAYRDVQLEQEGSLDRFPAGHLNCLGYGDLVKTFLVQRPIGLKKYISKKHI